MNYVPSNLTKKDRIKQIKNINKSKKSYKKKIYVNRDKLKSFTSKRSPHIIKACKLYNLKNITPNKELSRKTKCSLTSLKKIVEKGQGAYYSSGSRPNQSAKGWGLARLASALSGGKASISDFNLLVDGCEKNSLALKLAKKMKAK
jgi:hypothetical protein